jgi:hypothetical protein
MGATQLAYIGIAQVDTMTTQCTTVKYSTQVYIAGALERQKPWESCLLLVVTLSFESLVRLSPLGYFYMTIQKERRKKEFYLSSSRHTGFYGYNTAGFYWYTAQVGTMTTQCSKIRKYTVLGR